MNKQYPKLQQLLAGYFHQDWVDDHEHASDVLASFMSETSVETLEKVKKELRELLLIEQSEQ